MEPGRAFSNGNCDVIEETANSPKHAEAKTKTTTRKSCPSCGAACSDCDGSLWTFRSFLDSTTFHGAQFVTTGPERLQWAWRSLMLFAFCCFMAFFIRSLVQYHELPTTTRTRFVTTTEMTAPAVTVCSTSFIHFLHLDLNPFRMPEVALYCYLYDDRFLDYLFCNATRQELANILGNQTGRSGKQLIQSLGQQRERLFPDSLTRILNITDSGTALSGQSFSPVVTSEGLCYTYNSRGDEKPVRGRGFLAGREFIVDMESELHASLHRPELAMEVYVHNPNEPVVRGQAGVLVAPGTAANLRIRATRTQIYPRENGDRPCTAANLNRNKSLPYSPRRCQVECLEQHIADKCGCLAISVDAGTVLRANGSVLVREHCSALQYGTCEFGYSKRFLAGSSLSNACLKSCREPCEPRRDQFTYDVTVSTGSLPTGITSSVWSFALNLLPNGTTVQRHIVLGSRIALVRLFYDDLGFEEVTEKRSFTLTSLLGTVGGYLGLFLGASLLSVCELAQFLASLLWVKIRPGYYRYVHILGTRLGKQPLAAAV